MVPQEISLLQLLLVFEWSFVAFVVGTLIFGRERLSDRITEWMLAFTVGVVVGTAVV